VQGAIFVPDCAHESSMAHISGAVCAGRHRAGISTAGQHHLSTEMLGRLRPRPDLTPRLPAPPPPLPPHQPCRATKARQIPNRDLDTILRFRSAAATIAAHERGHRLDPDHQFLGCLDHLDHPEAVQSQQLPGQAVTVTRVRGLDALRCAHTHEDRGPLHHIADGQLRVTPHPNAKSPTCWHISGTLAEAVGPLPR